ncbi:adenine-specific DNA methylase [Natrinema sp. CBA1119]|uniref:DNA methyltransferase n=1 Tax=Natrinema sp. CBA1119 TaxID=1608465 RepID=UPI000BF6DEE8|nr:DNA methyltransferase [Natrinema sp. CBA1119]PGF15632.1 adenine-specific DNA methylase [Natrinema sp. CBA1119]
MRQHSNQLTLNAVGQQSHSLNDYDWTFANADTQYLTHGIHKYPARMPPQLPAGLFSHFKSTGEVSDGDTVYDPFSGSGTTATEARLRGINAIANDINPFAVELSKAKSTPLDLDKLDAAMEALLGNLQTRFRNVRAAVDRGEDVLPPELAAEAKQVSTDWFPEPQLTQLFIVRERLDSLADQFSRDIIRFLRIGLAKCARKVSYQRQGEFKRYRLAPADRTDHNPNVFNEIMTVLRDNRQRMRSFLNVADPSIHTRIEQADSRNSLEHPSLGLEENCADIIITSPPYGDHQTTVAYGEFSTNLSTLAFGESYDRMVDVDKRGLGGINVERTLSGLRADSESLHSVIEDLKSVEGRSKDALEFFIDFNSVIETIGKIIKPGQPVAWVVANRRMSDVWIPTHEIVRELCETAGYTTRAVLPRLIKDKTLPHSNRAGDTMTEEYIVVASGPEL